MLEIFIIPSIGVQTSLRTFRGSGGITEDGSWRALGEQGPGYWAGYMGAAEVGRGEEQEAVMAQQKQNCFPR